MNKYTFHYILEEKKGLLQFHSCYSRAATACMILQSFFIIIITSETLIKGYFMSG